ncbi:pyruvate kinase [Maribacter aestuarii]|uniref:pyruvate kinase n=1 Tax=Maribacter aestuarii TaxID=1130723 RepID=UPI00248BFB32|nr:pyruvate kinase [Maribacter aestuarii]
MEKLEVGDKMYNVVQDGFDDFARYSFSEVVKLTETLAVLKNGIRLINKPKPSYIMEDIGYSVSRKKGTHWHKVSLQAIRNAQIENEKIKVHNWFEEKEFSLEEKSTIYELLAK